MEQKTNNPIATVGVAINLTPTSAVYLALALIMPIVVFFLTKKYIQ